jgi:asparagine synthase (glutamine-hydrolysing)
LPDNLLMKGDKMTMAASLESRMPFLDYKLVEYAASIPSNIKIKPFKAKYLLKHAYQDFLPEVILTRKKMGFNMPIDVWFREEQRGLLARLLLSERTRSRGFLNDKFIARILSDHQEGRTNYGNQLFILASLELWFRVFIDSPSLEYPQGSMEDLEDKDCPHSLC